MIQRLISLYQWAFEQNFIYGSWNIQYDCREKAGYFFHIEISTSSYSFTIFKKINIFRYFYNVQKLIKNINASNKRKI